LTVCIFGVNILMVGILRIDISTVGILGIDILTVGISDSKKWHISATFLFQLSILML
jgi:hypothetical protein